MPVSPLITHSGRTMRLADWAREAGLKSNTLRKRLADGCTFAEAIARPLNTTRNGTAYGDGCIRPDGYRILSIDGRAVMEHVAIAEAALGKPLPPDAEVHHVDENRANNAPANLVICPDHAYHALLHVRMDALKATGDPDQRRCKFCSEFSKVEDLAPRAGWRGYIGYVHLACERAARQRNRLQRKEICNV